MSPRSIRATEVRLAFKEVISIFEREPGPDYLKVGLIFGNLSDALGNISEHDARIEISNRSLEIVERELVPSHTIVENTKQADHYRALLAESSR